MIWSCSLGGVWSSVLESVVVGRVGMNGTGHQKQQCVLMHALLLWILDIPYEVVELWRGTG